MISKRFKPRSGIRFTDDRNPKPAGGLVTGSAISPITLSAEAMESLIQLTGSVIDDSVGFGDADVRGLYDSSLRGESAKTLHPGSIVSRTPSRPSWTNVHLGQSMAYVISHGTASAETRTLNLYDAGRAAVEESPVPVSATLYYSKHERYRTIIVKRSASAADLSPGADDPIVTTSPGPGNPALYANYNGAYPGLASFSANTGTLCILTGAFGQSCPTIYYPAIFTVDVPVRGKLVDIKVWVELVHLSASDVVPPLRNIGIALRSPNMKWGNAHPIRNDSRYRAWDGASGSTKFNEFSLVPRFYVDTFLLWEGTGVPQDYTAIDPGSPDVHLAASRYPSFDRDRSIRTVFHDGAATPNPRELYAPTSPSGNYLGSPSHGLGRLTAFGSDVPWTSDATVFPATETHRAAGSPPKGWLTGPAKTNAVNEWPTTGSNYGAAEIKPVYPLLDTLYQIKRVRSDSPSTYGDATQTLFHDSDKWRGFRPGLRGSEISGTWKLMVYNGTTEMVTSTLMELYFRQFRLEITYDTGIGPVGELPAVTPRRSGPRFLYPMSGTDSAELDGGAANYAGRDYYINEVWTDVSTAAEVDHTFGITPWTGSFKDDYALLYRLSGTLADLSGSVPGWLLNNPFGVPQIPESSASLALGLYPNPSPVVASLETGKLLDGPRKLKDVARDINPAQTRVQLAVKMASGSI